MRVEAYEGGFYEEAVRWEGRDGTVGNDGGGAAFGKELNGFHSCEEFVAAAKMEWIGVCKSHDI